MRTTRMSIAVGDAFDLRSTVRSHGWSDLPPFATDETGDRLEIRFLLPEFGACRAELRQDGASLRARLGTNSPLTKAARESARTTIRSCMRLDLDLAEFWELCSGDPQLAWVPKHRAGRLLRSPTAFADAAAILATTNCSWALTRRIVAALVREWGEDGAFPRREALQSVDAAELRRRAPLGYRAPYLAKLARESRIEELRRRPDLPEAQLWRTLLDLPGFGPYAAGHLARLLGRFEPLAIDSMVRRRWKERFPRRQPTERAIDAHLKRYGRWKGLALWMLVTAEWYPRTQWRV